MTTKKKPIVATAQHTAEQWERRAIEAYRKQIEKATGKPLPPFHLSSGFTKAGIRDTKVAGQYFDPTCSADGVAHIFLNPREVEPVTLIATLVHEAIHVALGSKEGHGKKFQQVATSLGLVKPFTATTWGTWGQIRAETIAKRLGPFPRGAFISSGEGIKKQGTRLIKACCAECGYTIRIAQKWIDDPGLPMCPACDEPLSV